MKDGPTFLLLRARIPGEGALSLLGRLVTDPLRPLDNSVPKDPSKIIQSTPVEVQDKSALSEVQSSSDANVQAKVKDLIDLEGGTAAHDESRINNTIVSTYRLQDQYDAFKAIKNNEKVKETLQGPDGLFARENGILYMVIGVKTCSAGTTIQTKKGRDRKLAGKIILPLSQALGLPTSLDPELGAGIVKKVSSLQSSETVGEQVYAIEYRRVQQKNWLGRYTANTEPRVDRRVMTHEWGTAVFSDKIENDKNEMILDDDENDRLAAEDELVAEEALDEEGNADFELELDEDFFMPLSLDGEPVILV